MKDILRYASAPQESKGRGAGSRLTGLVLYAGVVAWCAYRLPSALTFVVPAATLAAVLHAGKGRPWLGLATFALIAFLVPALFWPSMLTDTFSDIGGS
jgi:hypothetical protein